MFDFVLRRCTAVKASVACLMAGFTLINGAAMATADDGPEANRSEAVRPEATIITHEKRRDGACEFTEGEAGLEVFVQGLQTTEGRVRAQIYSSDPDEFLEKGKKLVRVDMPLDGSDEPTLCVPLPSPGTYALVVMHDKNSNGRADIFSEGFGFSNNPKLSLGPPDGEEVMFTAAAGVSQHTIDMKYVFGGDEKKKEKRRKLKRR